ncbi:MAG: nucleotidyltransferase domain-containing protein [bacterium]
MAKTDDQKPNDELLKIDTKIRRLVDKIVSELSPEKVILFGSYAYGKASEDSDIDLLVIYDTP